MPTNGAMNHRHAPARVYHRLCLGHRHARMQVYHRLCMNPHVHHLHVPNHGHAPAGCIIVCACVIVMAPPKLVWSLAQAK